MGKVAISPNPIKKKIFINAKGDEVKPFTNEVIAPAEPEYTPPTQTVVVETKSENPFASVMKDMLKEQMREGLKEAMGDMKNVMAEVLKDAFKK